MFNWRFWLTKQPTFKQAADEWLYKQQLHWASQAFDRAKIHFESWVYPVIGNKKISRITPKHIANIIRESGINAPSRARLILQRLNRVFRYAKACGWIKTNPAEGLGEMLEPINYRGFAFLQPAEMPQFFADISRKSNHTLPEYTALLLLAYTAVRRSEACLAEWCEFDWQSSTWTIPARRMKKRRAHLVPLAPQVIQLLQDWLKQREALGITGSRLFGEMAVHRPIELIKQAKWQKRMTIHGFRKVFSTAAHESNLWSMDAIELQLAHAIPGVRGVYNKACMLEERRKLMVWYADQIDGWRRL